MFICYLSRNCVISGSRQKPGGTDWITVLFTQATQRHFNEARGDDLGCFTYEQGVVVQDYQVMQIYRAEDGEVFQVSSPFS